MFKGPKSQPGPRQIFSKEFIIKTMIKAHAGSIRKASTVRLRAFAIAILLVASNIALPGKNSAGEPPTNVQFVTGHSALNIPFEFEYNEIVLQVRVNNSAPLKFMFDTGAGASILNARQAAWLNLKQVDSVKATGVGGNVQGSLATGVSLSVPGVKVLNQRLVLLPLDFPFCEASDIDGIIGYDFIKEFVVEINYDARTLSLLDPLSYRYTGRGDMLPLTIKGTPRVHALIALPGKPPIEGLFEIDTGSDGALTINSPFVNRHQLLSALSTQVSNSERGLGGESKRFDARLGNMQLGRFKINAPIVGFSTAAKGSMAAEDNDGPIGNEIMRRFKVVIDYSRQRMMLEPNAHLSDPFETDMSGIDFDSEGKDCRVFKVTDVAEKSPAAEAGILSGDEIVAINDKPANQFTSTEIEKLLMQDGAEHSLTLRRANNILVVKIKLRRLV
ncbi:MAG TPA: aspartyl protease family protein [Pyrinomonadaceae bacterium]|nr:aspartyl protease family protein [Pyrinomonadaceae bacterium]